MNNAGKVLKQVFGYDEFRPLQEIVINNILNKKDTLTVMPTGSGKSLCYQIPALLFDGLTIVVSPLISLMKDQVEQLDALGINAVVLNSSLSYKEYRRNIYMIKSNQVKFLYLAPETLLKESIIELLKTVNVSSLTIDEAHCISSWGHDFRPEYRMLTKVRDNFPDAVCVAFTATATLRVRQDIRENLAFSKSNTFISSFNRANLFLQIIDKKEPLYQTISFLRKYPNQSGIIYCYSRKQVDELYDQLAANGFSVKPYHAGLSEKLRTKNQDIFIKDDIQIIVATIAFGMGINKPNVRFVIHYDLPKNIESYYQEIGRAGRDGLKAHCLMLFNYADVFKIRHLISKQSENEQKIYNAQLSSLVSYAQSDHCRRVPMLGYFGEDFTEENCGMCDICVSEPKEKQDLTIEAQKFLSCIKRTREIYGAVHIINILRGSMSKKVMQSGHQNLSTYGIGSNFSKKEWIYISQQLIASEFIKQDLQYGSLKLTEKAYQLFRNEIKFKGFLIKNKDNEEPKAVNEDIGYNKELLEVLKQKRRELANIIDVPAYIIFSDKTLIEMAEALPKDEQSMLMINGVGTVKFQKYGMIFLDIIKKHS